MQALGIALADAVGIAATTGGLRQPALDHVFGGLEESLDEPLLPTHHLILSYGSLVFVSRELDMNYQKCLGAPICTTMRTCAAPRIDGERLSRSFLRQEVD